MKEKYNSVFEALGFSDADSYNLTVRSELLMELERYIKENFDGQREAAEFFGEKQPVISRIQNGKIDSFTVDKLISLLGKTGKKIEFSIKAA